MKLSHEILVESRSARGNALSSLDTEKVLEIFDKAKALVLALWNGTGYATTSQIAEYYEVVEQTIKNLLERHAQEFSGEVELLKGKELQDARLLLSLPLKTSQANIWTVKAMLRVGLLLTESEVAKKVRDVVLDLLIPASITTIQEVYQPAKINMNLLEISVQTGQAILSLGHVTESGFNQAEQAIKSASQDVKLSVAAETVSVVSELRYASQEVTSEVVTVQKMLSDLEIQVSDLKQSLPVIPVFEPKVKRENYRFPCAITIRLTQEDYDTVTSISTEKGISRASLVCLLIQEHLL